MTKKKKGIILIILFTIVTFADCFLTWVGTPTLEQEANPLVAVLGHGWTELILVNVLILLIYAILVYYSFGIYQTPSVVAKDENELKRLLKKDSKGSTFAMLGYGMAYSMILSRLILVVEWLFVILGKRESLASYWAIRRKFPASRPDIMVAVVLTVVFSTIWMIKDYKEKEANAVISADGHNQ